eukprot:CAMPEP_0176056544 /NCGR_PEP_ID=MMETSP0120_2-20121206/28159_1 /TAXON_ID=160619 /ORGANISM="Kryptoperidinium foliaceum, Strain CCMP 1326" /LENGTH=164 /DNA_ID=CAMNT_0017390051 /DNA_START=256 /DNA_END=750 /DNA_ORIENTATION=+
MRRENVRSIECSCSVIERLVKLRSSDCSGNIDRVAQQSSSWRSCAARGDSLMIWTSDGVSGSGGIMRRRWLVSRRRHRTGEVVELRVPTRSSSSSSTSCGASPVVARGDDDMQRRAPRGRSSLPAALQSSCSSLPALPRAAQCQALGWSVRGSSALITPTGPPG